MDICWREFLGGRAHAMRKANAGSLVCGELRLAKWLDGNWSLVKLKVWLH